MNLDIFELKLSNVYRRVCDNLFYNEWQAAGINSSYRGVITIYNLKPRVYASTSIYLPFNEDDVDILIKNICVT